MKKYFYRALFFLPVMLIVIPSFILSYLIGDNISLPKRLDSILDKMMEMTGFYYM